MEAQEKRAEMFRRNENLAIYAEQAYREIIEVAKVTAVVLDGCSDKWRVYLSQEGTRLVAIGELMFGEVE